MILVKASAEYLTDMFTPGVFNPARCVSGLPKGATLVNVTMATDGTDIVTFVFDDGTEKLTEASIKFEAVIPPLETV